MYARLFPVVFACIWTMFRNRDSTQHRKNAIRQRIANLGRGRSPPDWSPRQRKEKKRETSTLTSTASPYTPNRLPDQAARRSFNLTAVLIIRFCYGSVKGNWLTAPQKRAFLTHRVVFHAHKNSGKITFLEYLPQVCNCGLLAFFS